MIHNKDIVTKVSIPSNRGCPSNGRIMVKTDSQLKSLNPLESGLSFEPLYKHLAMMAAARCLNPLESGLSFERRVMERMSYRCDVSQSPRIGAVLRTAG